MRLPDPIGLREKLQHTHVICASSQFAKSGEIIHSFLGSEDCFVLAQGSTEFPHSDIAALTTTSSTLWALNLLKSHHSYWRDKKLVAGRIIRSVNWTLYSKRRDSGFEKGLGSGVEILLFGEKYFFIISVGLVDVYLIRQGKISRLLSDSSQTSPSSLLGIEKKEPVHLFYSDKLQTNDIFILSSSNIEEFSSLSIIQSLLNGNLTSPESLQKTSDAILGLAKKKKLSQYMVSIVTYL